MTAIDYDLTPLTSEKDAILAEAQEQGCVRVFGYGSLVWRPNFPVMRELHGFIRGHARRFYQASPDHRGTPQAMGRVCALIKAPGETTHGSLFEIALEDASTVLDDLFFREKAGYECARVEVVLGDGSTLRALTFTADETGLFWAGPRTNGIIPSPIVLPSAAAAPAAPAAGSSSETAPPSTAATPPFSSSSPCFSHDNSHCTVDAIAGVIATAVGPSGSNVQYLARLLKALRDRGVVDGHLEELWENVVHKRKQLGLDTPEVEAEGLPTISMMIEATKKKK